ncbi:MAG TPA: maltose ABC transporter permease MalF, partial [Burkholderiaceae bacterium]|nr:maltose ABC transporter permease MalF [Burkholderiaceae bacterium]
MNAATPPAAIVGSPAGAARRARPAPSAAARWLARTVLALATLALLWMVMGLFNAGQPLVAVGVMAFGGTALAVYGSARSLAWRYLFPGVAGMLLFVAFPLLYTVQIGFTNYSSSNLLEFERAREYLLAQTLADEAHAYDTTLHAAGGVTRLVLASRESGARYSVQVPTGGARTPLALQPLADDPGPALPLREVIALRERLLGLQLAAPDGRVLSYAGLREFAPLEPVWTARADGSLTHTATGTVYTPNRASGFFENAAGERVTPGFRVGIGLANYSRMLFDADFRGPFVAIFVWTVVFAGLTVLFAGGLGMALAVLLNWEALPHRTLYRTLLFLPYAVPGFISILVFKGLFNQNFGEINAILHALFGIRPAWFADPLLAKVMLLVVNTWLGFPYFMILCTGLIKAIPADLY